MVPVPPLIKRSLWIAGLAVGIYLLYHLSQIDYLIFHTFAEIVTALVAAAIFLIAWNSRKIVRNDYLLFLGIAFLFVAGIDSLHTLAYQGMAVFPDFPGANLPTQLWLVSRYLLAVSLLVSPIFLVKKLPTALVTVLYLLVTSFLLGTIFYWRIFPAAYVDGVGLTGFKIISEYIFIFLFIASGALLYYFRNKLDPIVYRNLLISIAFALVTELFFTLYVGVYDYFNYLGHIAKLISYYYLYKGVVEVSLDKPYALLFRNLELANARKDEFIRFLGHELRTPLTTIKLYSEMLESDLEGSGDKEKTEMAEKIREQADVIQLLISDLVDASRIETGAISFEMTPVDLDKLAADTVATSKKIYQDKNVEFDLTGKIGKAVSADPRRIAQVLSNLIANGIKYSNREPVKIAIRLAESGKWARVSVTDNGVGIPPEELNKIFDKYYRTEEGKNKAKGLGLGLYLASEIMKRHRGRIEAKSEVGEGSTFTIYLPLN